MGSHVRLKTISMIINNNENHKIFDHMTKISKNIYNCTIYCSTIFNKYKQDIFKQLYISFKNKYGDEFKNLKVPDKKKELSGKIKEEIEIDIYKLYDKKYVNYSNLNKTIMNNNRIIYQFIKNLLKPTDNICLLTNDNYKTIRQIIIYNMLNDTNIICTDEDKIETVINIVDDILSSMYLRLFDEQKIIGKCIIKRKKKINWKKGLEKRFNIKLISDNNIIGRVTYKNLGENKDKLPSDIIINIMQKAYTGYKSFFALKKNNIKCNTPKYLPKNSTYLLPFHAHSFKKIDNTHIRLTVGKYVAENYLNIVKNKKIVCINEYEKTDYKKYIQKNKIKHSNKKINKQKNFILGNGNYINKKNNNIINGYYMNIIIPKKLADKNITHIEIIPIYENHCYHLNITYEKQIDKLLPEQDNNQLNDACLNPDDSISIDLGMSNLMSIYDRTGKPHIISGKYLIWLNNSYNNLIDKIKSETKKKNDKDTSKRIRNLLLERTNKIDTYFNLVVKWLLNKYKDKKLFIIGYNVGWKTNVNLGNKMNRKFYGIPYTKLMYKLTNLIRENGIDVRVNEESYTSKCDGLALEEVGFQENYLGKRIKRGLFSSSVGKLLNADINGAINIMRKFYQKHNITINTIKGINICNPIKVTNIGEEVRQMNHLLKVNSITS